MFAWNCNLPSMMLYLCLCKNRLSYRLNYITFVFTCPADVISSSVGLLSIFKLKKERKCAGHVITLYLNRHLLSLNLSTFFLLFKGWSVGNLFFCVNHRITVVVFIPYFVIYTVDFWYTGTFVRYSNVLTDSWSSSSRTCGLAEIKLWML